MLVSFKDCVETHGQQNIKNVPLYFLTDLADFFQISNCIYSPSGC